MSPRLEVTGLSRSFESAAETVHAVRDVSFQAAAGELVCITGASGSGKTTLLNLLAGLDHPDRGTIQAGQYHVSELDEAGLAEMRLRYVGVVFQENNLIEEFTALENVALPLEIAGSRWSEARQDALRQLERVGIEDLRDRRPSDMSGGQRQRVGIARALVGHRQVLLADEPTGALDSRSSRELFQLLRTLCDLGMTTVVCTHDALCSQYADTHFEMTDGRLLRTDVSRSSTTGSGLR